MPRRMGTTGAILTMVIVLTILSVIASPAVSLLLFTLTLIGVGLYKLFKWIIDVVLG